MRTIPKKFTRNSYIRLRRPGRRLEYVSGHAAFGLRDPGSRSLRARRSGTAKPSGGAVRGHEAFGRSGPEEASGVLLGVRAKTPRLSTWRLFLFFRRFRFETVTRRQEWPVPLPVRVPAARRPHLGYSCPDEERPGATPPEEAGTGPFGVRQCTRVHALERGYRYQPESALSTTYCGIDVNIEHIWCGKMDAAIPESIFRLKAAISSTPSSRGPRGHGEPRRRRRARTSGSPRS